MEEILKKSSIFFGIDEKEYLFLEKCLKFQRQTFNKNQMVFIEGELIEGLGVVLSGSVSVEHYDFEGKSTVMNIVHPGDIFGESYAALHSMPLLVNIRALEKTEILFMKLNNLLTTCSVNCSFHTQILKNLFSLMAKKNIGLTNKIFESSPKTIRERVLIFLQNQAKIKNSKKFEIKYNRQQMADYLNVERSALSGELSNMKNEGLINFKKNYFEIL